MNKDFYIHYSLMQRQLFQAGAQRINQKVLAMALNGNLTKEALWNVIKKERESIYRVAYRKGHKETTELFRLLKKAGEPLKEDKGPTFSRLKSDTLFEYCWQAVEERIRHTQAELDIWRRYATAMSRPFDRIETAESQEVRRQSLINEIRRAVLLFFQGLETYGDVDGRDDAEKEVTNGRRLEI